MLAASRLSNRQQSFTIINALTGAARPFFRACELNFDTTTPVDVLNKLVALVPDHKAMFTQKALDMSFSLNTLRDNIETFGLLVQHGELPADGSRFWYKHLVQKMLTVRADILTLSHNFLNEQLEFRTTESFGSLITRAIAIVSRLNHEGLLVHDLRKKRDAPSDVGDSADTKQKKEKKPKVNASAKNSKKWGELSNAALAKRFDRCGKCGRYVADPAARAAHVQACNGETDRAGKDLLNTRLGKVRALVKQGKADDVNVFGKRAPPGPSQ